MLAGADDNPTPTNTQQRAWQLKAASQGLVCLVCGRVPALERRPLFYDTGLCRDCAEEQELEQANGSRA
jgi:hypothetical protein